MYAVSGELDGERAIFLRRRGEADFHKIPGSENGWRPSFSPDSEWIVYRNHAEGTLDRIGVSGGGRMTLVDDETIRPYFPHWGRDGTIAFGGPGGNYIIPAEGGPPVHVPSLGGVRPFVLPDGSGLLNSPRRGAIQIHHFASDSTWDIIADGTNPVYAESGHILYTPASGGLFAVPFDLETRQVTGRPQRILDRLASDAGSRGYSVSRSGTLVLHDGEPELRYEQSRLVILDRPGAADTLPLAAGWAGAPAFSPDGTTVAYDFAPTRDGQANIYAYDLLRGTNSQITFEGDNRDPVWSPDGARILFSSERENSDRRDLYVKPADNSSGAIPVVSQPGRLTPNQWLEDDLIVFTSRVGADMDIWTHALEGGGDPKPYLEAPWIEAYPSVSPDGGLAAYMSSETNPGGGLWLNDFPLPAGKRNVAPSGYYPRWAPDGGTLYYWRRTGGVHSLLSVTVERTPILVHQGSGSS
jgi:Tol biopolymer transport system component